MKALFKPLAKDRKPKEKTRLSPLDAEDPAYIHVKKLFEDGWLHSNKPRPFIHSIFQIRLSETIMEPFHNYFNAVVDAVGPWNFDNAQRLLFHGTVRACALGETTTSVRLCSLPKCSICCILTSSFDISKCGSRNPFSRFGTGIYTTSCSSKADDYVSDARDKSQLRILLVNSVVVGKEYKMARNSTKIARPPHGNHSILGITGQDLNYEETVVYANEAIRPLYLITYGSNPKPKKRTAMKILFNTPLV